MIQRSLLLHDDIRDEPDVLASTNALERKDPVPPAPENGGGHGGDSSAEGEGGVKGTRQMRLSRAPTIKMTSYCHA